MWQKTTLHHIHTSPRSPLFVSVPLPPLPQLIQYWISSPSFHLVVHHWARFVVSAFRAASAWNSVRALRGGLQDRWIWGYSERIKRWLLGSTMSSITILCPEKKALCASLASFNIHVRLNGIQIHDPEFWQGLRCLLYLRTSPLLLPFKGKQD